MHITHAQSDIAASRGGVVAALAGLLPALRAQNLEVDLVAIERPDDVRSQSPLDGPHLHLAHGHDPIGFGYASDLKALARRVAARSEVIHSHGIWIYMSYVAYRVARERKIPHIISVHGMMEPYIHARSRFKKAPIEWWFQTRALRQAAVIHALCAKEVEDIRAQGFTNPVAVVPNGVDLASVDGLPSQAVFEAKYPATQGKNILLFMARLHPKKGLLHFLPAWKKYLEAHPQSDWHFVVAGPDEGGHSTELEALVQQLGLEEKVTFTGTLTGESKREALGAAAAFVLPSHSEGFSMSLLEAMGACLPLLITPGCNFPEAVAAQAAISVPATEAGALQGLQELLNLSPADRQQMGDNGRTLVERNYSWATIAQSMAQVYTWCTGKGDKPTCIVD